MRRRRLALLLTIAIAAAAGCLGPFGDSAVPAKQLGETANYDWNVTANATYTIATNGTYRAVYRLPPGETEAADGNGTTDGTRTLELHRRDGLGQRRPLEISALRYRFPNGTVRNGSRLAASEGNQHTTVELPAGEGMVAYTARSPPKRFETAVLIEGSHEVILPTNRRVANPIFGHVSPPTDARNWTPDDRRRLQWESVDRDRLSVRYYRPWDLRLFAGLVGILLVIGGVAAAAVYRQIRRLRARREEHDLDLEYEDSGEGPPPGLR
jgi:hypothetical protein